jgi:hypothetical protein
MWGFFGTAWCAVSHRPQIYWCVDANRNQSLHQVGATYITLPITFLRQLADAKIWTSSQNLLLLSPAWNGAFCSDPPSPDAVTR